MSSKALILAFVNAMLLKITKGDIMWPSTILMVRPNGFRVDYAINPYMLDASGNLQQVDAAKAHQQWNNLKNKFESLNFKVDVIEGDTNCPDMVFCANQTLPFINEKNQKCILLSRMHSDFRKPEVKYFKEWAEKNNFLTTSITDFDFEGCGDAIWNYEKDELFGGYGFRTSEKVYDQIETIINKKIKRLELVSPQFYHLDTCFVVLNAETVAYVPEAFAPHSLKIIENSFKNLIPIDLNEALKSFAGNALSLNGKDIVLHPGPEKFKKKLKELDFNIHEVDVSEFLKSGGAVFCMKQILF